MHDEAWLFVFEAFGKNLSWVEYDLVRKHFLFPVHCWDAPSLRRLVCSH